MSFKINWIKVISSQSLHIAAHETQIVISLLFKKVTQKSDWLGNICHSIMHLCVKNAALKGNSLHSAETNV